MTNICEFMKCYSECSNIQMFKKIFCTPTFFNENTCTYKYLPSPPINFDKIVKSSCIKSKNNFFIF